ncbi:MAG: NPCBM/NEW2 domain-containing protein [Rubrivivax sp.]
MILLALALLAQDSVTIVSASNAPLQVRELSLEIQGGVLTLSAVDAAGKALTLKGEDVVEIVFNSARPAPAGKPAAEDVEILLTCGDVWIGRLGPPAEDGIRLLSPALGDPLVKFGQIRAVLFSANKAYLPVRLPEKAESSDLVLTRSGDRAEGTVLALSNAGLSYKSKRLETDVAVPLSQAAGLWLIETEAAPKEGAGLQISAITLDGSTLRGEVQGLKGGVLEIKDLYGALHKIPLNLVSGLFVKNGRVVYLSDLTPSKVDEDANYIRGPVKLPSDLDYPWQRDRNARGGKLVLGGSEHRKGVGVRAHSSLTYALEGAFARFQTTFGLDVASLGLGAVKAEVWVDGKLVKDMTVKGNEAAIPVDVDVKAARELRLLVTWAGFGQSDFADWGSARLVR